jgi:allantoinase
MSGLDLVVRGGTVVAPGGARRADVGVADGRIAAIAPELDGGAREEVDAAGLHVLPGAVDAHVHLNDPGRADWEGFRTGTRALAAGGSTTCVDMPLNALPPTVDAAAFDAKVAAANGTALVDFALWGGLVPGNVERLPELAARGAVGFKAFMSDSGVPEFARADDLTLYEGMRAATAVGLPVAVHAESEEITSRLAARARAEGRTGVRDYLRSRPAIAEVEAIGRALLLARETGCAVHVVHVSTGRGVGLVAEAHAGGVDATCETCPHYLVLDEEDAERLGAVAKCAPPLRPATERDALWDALDDIAFVASDHSPAPARLKRGEDCFAVWGGISGAQSLLALLLDAGHHERGVPLERLADLSAAGAAESLRLRAKGRLEPGADADLVLVDLDGRATVEPQTLEYRHPHGHGRRRRHRAEPLQGGAHGLPRADGPRGRPAHRAGAPAAPRDEGGRRRARARRRDRRPVPRPQRGLRPRARAGGEHAAGGAASQPVGGRDARGALHARARGRRRGGAGGGRADHVRRDGRGAGRRGLSPASGGRVHHRSRAWALRRRDASAGGMFGPTRSTLSGS